MTEGIKEQKVAEFITYKDFTGKDTELMVIDMQDKNSIAYFFTRGDQQFCEVMPNDVAEKAARMTLEFLGKKS